MIKKAAERYPENKARKSQEKPKGFPSIRAIETRQLGSETNVWLPRPAGLAGPTSPETWPRSIETFVSGVSGWENPCNWSRYSNHRGGFTTSNTCNRSEFRLHDRSAIHLAERSAAPPSCLITAFLHSYRISFCCVLLLLLLCVFSLL